MTLAIAFEPRAVPATVVPVTLAFTPTATALVVPAAVSDCAPIATPLSLTSYVAESAEDPVPRAKLCPQLLAPTPIEIELVSTVPPVA